MVGGELLGQLAWFSPATAIRRHVGGPGEELGRDGKIAAVMRPSNSRQVVDALAADEPCRGRGFGGPDRGAKRLGAGMEVEGVPPPQGFRLPVGVEVHPAEGPDRLEQSVRHEVVAVHHERPVHQRGEAVEHLDLVGAFALHRHGITQGERPGEHRQPSEEPLLVGFEEPVRPLHGRLEGLVARHGRAPAAREQPEPLAEVVGDVLRRHRRHPCRGQLDGQGYPVESPADLVDRVEGRLVAGRPGTGAIEEEGDGLGLLDPLAGQRQGAQGEEPLAAGGQRLPAGRQHGRVRGSRRDGVHQLGNCTEQVLAVVEDEQRLPLGQPRDHGRSARQPHPDADPQGRGNELVDLVGGLEAAELDEHRPVARPANAPSPARAASCRCPPRR